LSLEVPVNTVTLFTPRQVSERNLAEDLGRQFGAAWFPEYHRCSLDTDDAVVYVDFDPAYTDRLTADELRTLAGQLGFVPKFALHVSPSTVYPGSPALAQEVLAALTLLVVGREVPAPAPLDPPARRRP
jgi:hypothetical protein